VQVRLFVRIRAVDYYQGMIKNILSACFVTALIVSQAMAKESAETVEAVENVLPRHVGACAIALEHGKVVFEHAYGIANAETEEPCTPATNFRIASVSKQFTATAVMLLVDRGKVSLQDRLTKFFPGFPKYGETISIEQLLTHRSGLPDYEQLIPKGTALQLDDLDVLHLLMDTKAPLFEPGSKFQYSNSGYTLLGLIVELVAQRPFQRFMVSDVFRPLGMSNSVLYQRGLNSVPNRAFGHAKKDGAWVKSDQSLTSAVRGDGGVYTSLEDYQKWLRGIDEHKLLSKASYAAMFSPHTATDRNGAHYGYGWFIGEYRGEPRIFHNGETHGFRACVQRFPKRDAAIFFQINNEIEGDSERLTKIGEQLSDILIFKPR
jgi:CubicO group peptidase (beta-lactamase class C family)